MKQKLYTLYDKIAEQYGPIFQAANNAVAIRSVQNMKIRAYEDFDLILVGEWDMETGQLGVASVIVVIDWVTPKYKDELKSNQMELLK